MGMIWNNGGAGGPPSGAAGGDLAGTYPSPQLANNATARTDLGLGSVATHPVTDLLQTANNLSDLAVVATARGNLGLGTAAQQASAFFLQAANNLSDVALPATARINLGLGSVATHALTDLLQVGNNLSDLANAVTARANLGLGSIATHATTDFYPSTDTLDQFLAPVAAVNHNSQKITSLANGTAATDGAAFGQIPIYLPSGAGAGVTTSQSTTSTTYTDLVTVGPTVTITTKTSALVFLACSMLNTAAGQAAWMSFAISGATTLAAADGTSLEIISTSANNLAQLGTFAYVSGLTAGSNTFTPKYRVAANTGTYASRFLAVIPLPV